MLTTFPYQADRKVLQLKPTFDFSPHLRPNLFCFTKLLQDMLFLKVSQGGAITDQVQGTLT